MTGPLAAFDAPYIRLKRFLTGVDEAGRGALAGPVVAAAVAVSDRLYADDALLASIERLDDSKKLDARVRSELFEKLCLLKKNGVIDFEAAQAGVEEIEALNIVGATRLAMRRALDAVNSRLNLALAPSSAPATLFGEGGADLSRSEVLIDGVKLRGFPYRHTAVVKGDAKSLAIAAASIVAKVTRDRLMEDLAAVHPRYGFEVHKGYGTPAHMQALLVCGACPVHRPSFLKNLRAEPEAQASQGELF